jgi:hypothetical protein
LGEREIQRIRFQEAAQHHGILAEYQEDPPEFISIIKEDNTRANKSTIPSTSMEFNETTILDPPDTPAERTIAGKYSSQNQQQKK